jgi:hypothetical protein
MDLDILTYHIRNQSRNSQASITFLSECRLETNQQLQVNNHEIFIHGESSHTGGVGIVLNKHATHAWKLAGSQPPIAIKGRIMGLHLEFGHETKKNTPNSSLSPPTYLARDQSTTTSKPSLTISPFPLKRSAKMGLNPS